jgi:hypothetical protein
MAAPARTAPSIAHRRVRVGDGKDFNAFRQADPIKQILHRRSKYQQCEANVKSTLRQGWTFCHVRPEFALLPITDIRQMGRHVRSGPEAEVAGSFDRLMTPTREPGP